MQQRATYKTAKVPRLSVYGCHFMHHPARTLPSVRTQIALIFGSLTATLAITLSFIAGELLTWRLEQQAGAALSTVAQNAAMLLSKELLQQSHRAQVLARSKELWDEGLDSPSVGKMLDRIQHINPHNVWIGVADEQGVVRNATGNMLTGVNVSTRPWFRQGMVEPFISEVHPAKLLADLLPRSSTGEPLRLVDFSAPIHRPDGSIAGVLGIHGSWDWVRDIVEGLLSSTGRTLQQSIFIFDRKGELIYAPDGVMAPYTSLGQSLPVSQALHQREALITAAPIVWKDRPQAYLTTAARLPDFHADLGWWVVARQPVETAYADAKHILWWALAAGLMVGLLSALLARSLARSVSDDLSNLAVAASRISAGNTQQEIPLSGNNREVRQLSASLSQMTQQLLDANAAMHSQVQLRTQELHTANQELKLANQTLQRLASTDPLTGLLNRRGFEAQASLVQDLALRSGRPLSVISMDIDFFKRINDRYGHDAGDGVLQQLALVLTQRTRKTDLVARFGGEEFVILLPDTEASAAQHLASDLLSAIEKMSFTHVGSLTLSAGVSSLHSHGNDDLAAMIRRSDEALYEAKHNGRNCVVYAS